MTMMYALISEGRVTELPEVRQGDRPLAERYHPDVVAACVEVPADLSGVIAPGWSWDGATFAPPPPAPDPLPAPLPPLTARQLRLWLLGQGITRAMVEAKLEALPELDREAAEIEWEYSTQYLREHPLIVQIGGAFGLSAADIDAAWPEAAAL